MLVNILHTLCLLNPINHRPRRPVYTGRLHSNAGEHLAHLHSLSSPLKSNFGRTRRPVYAGRLYSDARQHPAPRAAAATRGPPAQLERWVPAAVPLLLCLCLSVASASCSLKAAQIGGHFIRLLHNCLAAGASDLQKGAGCSCSILLLRSTPSLCVQLFPTMYQWCAGALDIRSEEEQLHYSVHSGDPQQYLYLYVLQARPTSAARGSRCKAVCILQDQFCIHTI